MSNPAPPSAPARPAAVAPDGGGGGGDPSARPLITGLAHVNLTVPAGALDAARAFYGGALGLAERAAAGPSPASELAWFDVDAGGGQQLHVAAARGPDDANAAAARRHPCFRLADAAALAALHRRLAALAGPAAPLALDDYDPSVDVGADDAFPARFFARDFAGNRLEFSL